MYLAVGLMLAGWTIGTGSRWLLLYTMVVLVAFHLRVRLGEEPWLRRTYRHEWDRYAARVPRWLFPSRRSQVVSLLALIVAVAVAGLIYEAYAEARAAREFPPPGMMVDIGGRRLHLLCIGDGEPTVIVESSGWGNATSAPAARARMAGRTRVCSYDRRGMGWSDPGPATASPASLAQDLALLQDHARLRAPYVIVASSIGGLTAEMFARQYPERVAGVVFLDAASSELLPALSPELGRAKVVACAADAAGRFGVIRLLDPFGLGADTSEDAWQAAAITYGARSWAALCALVRGVAADPAAFDKAPPLTADLPLVVLSASSDENLLPADRWLGLDLHALRIPSQQRLAARSTRGTWRVVPDSTHLIASSQPEAVADAVLALLDQIRGP